LEHSEKSGGILVAGRVWPQERFQLGENFIKAANLLGHRQIRAAGIRQSEPIVAAAAQNVDFLPVGKAQHQVLSLLVALLMNRADSPLMGPNPQSAVRGSPHPAHLLTARSPAIPHSWRLPGDLR